MPSIYNKLASKLFGIFVYSETGTKVNRSTFNSLDLGLMTVLEVGYFGLSKICLPTLSAHKGLI